MEFYFSDSNLAKDRFMKNLIQSSENGCKYNAVYGNEKYQYMFLLFVPISSWNLDTINVLIYIYSVSYTWMVLKITCMWIYLRNELNIY